MLPRSQSAAESNHISQAEPLLTMNEDQKSCRVDCNFAFRVECHDEGIDCYNRRLSNGDMVPRSTSPTQQPWLDMVDNHLSWDKTGTPFISFFRSWERVLRWREWRIKNQAGWYGRPAENVVVIAVWLGGMQNVYSAHRAATKLGYKKNSPDTRRSLGNYDGEVLVQGSILESEHRILALFHGNQRELESVQLEPMSTRNETVTVRVPYQSLVAPGELAEGANERLRLEVFKRMGVTRDDARYCMLVLALHGKELTARESDGRVVVEDTSSAERKCYSFLIV